MSWKRPLLKGICVGPRDHPTFSVCQQLLLWGVVRQLRHQSCGSRMSVLVERNRDIFAMIRPGMRIEELEQPGSLVVQAWCPHSFGRSSTSTFWGLVFFLGDGDELILVLIVCFRDISTHCIAAKIAQHYCKTLDLMTDYRITTMAVYLRQVVECVWMPWCSCTAAQLALWSQGLVEEADLFPGDPPRRSEIFMIWSVFLAFKVHLVT